MSERLSYDVFTYHDLTSTTGPVREGESVVLDGLEWEVVMVGAPVHEGRVATLYCKLPRSVPFPASFRP